jgi:hypothetical protein
MTANKRVLTLIENLQVAIFEFLIRQELPLKANYHHPSILIDLKGRRVIVSLIDDDTSEFKSSTYILDRGSEQ